MLTGPRDIGGYHKWLATQIFHASSSTKILSDSRRPSFIPYLPPQQRTMLIPILHAALRPVVSQYINPDASPEDPIDSPDFWLKMIVSGALVLLGGVFAG